jgi:hypothetical protein
MTLQRVKTIEEGKKDYPLYLLLQLCAALEVDAAEVLKQAEITSNRAATR